LRSPTLHLDRLASNLHVFFGPKCEMHFSKGSFTQAMRQNCEFMYVPSVVPLRQTIE
jgi:hypothetical protein